ncbi:amidohydrolase family protein [Mesorhizobium wenxiniae]
MLKGGLVLAHADDEASERDLVIRGDTIIAMGKDLAPGNYGVTEVHSADGFLVAPGYVNTHYHSHDRWDRGRFSPLPLEIWMSIYNPPTVGRNWTPDEIYLRTLIGGMELVRGGATAVMDDVHLGLQLDSPTIEAVFRAYEDLGLRADVGIAYSDRPGHETIPYLDDALPAHLKSRGQSAVVPQCDMLEIWKVLADKYDGRVRSVVSVSGPQRCSVKFQQDAWDLADSLSRPVLTHVLESRVQAMSGPYFYGKSIVSMMAEIGVLRSNSVLIHGVWMCAEDLDVIAASGSKISHNPVSNLKLGSGIAPVIEMLSRGISVGLGTDNHNGNDGCSMFESVKLGVMLQTTQTDDYERWLDASAGLRSATRHGASLMARGDNLGALQPGFKADFLMFDLEADAFTPLNDVKVHLVFADAARALRHSYVDGLAILRNGEFVTVDEGEVRREIKGRLAVIQKKVLDGIPKGKELEPYLVEAYRKCLESSFAKPYAGRCNCWRPAGFQALWS